jgi:hypothetical protein
MGQDEGQDRTAARVIGAVYAMVCLVYMVWGMWTLLPEHRRTAIKLRLLRSCAQGTTTLARRTGAASIDREARTGVQLYAVPYRLSLARDRLLAAYDVVKLG